MKTMKKIFEIFITNLFIYYIWLCYKTGKTTVTGCYELAKGEGKEKYVVGFWHGESHCCYPVLKNNDVYIVTTTNRRGDYIANIGKHFGYIPLRIPDESKGENHMFKIRSLINGAKQHNIALTLDGPAGPYHEPKKFVLLTAVMAKRKMILMSFKMKGKINLNKRWDKYLIPLPFYRAEVHFHDPIEIKKEEMEITAEKITKIMEDYNK